VTLTSLTSVVHQLTSYVQSEELKYDTIFTVEKNDKNLTLTIITTEKKTFAVRYLSIDIRIQYLTPCMLYVNIVELPVDY